MALILPINITLSNTWQDITTDIFDTYNTGDNVDMYIIYVDSQPFEILVDKSGVAVIDASFNEKGLRIDQYFNSGGYTLNDTFKYYARCIKEKGSLNIRPTPVIMVSASAADYAGNMPMNTEIGERIVGELSDAFNVMFEYNVGTYDTNRVVTGTGDITHADAKAQLHTGVGVNVTELTSKDPVRYATGHQINVEGTAIFATPEANVEQILGLGDDTDSLAAFGYDGTVFGIWLTTITGGRTHIPQSSFNGDKVDGTGDSGFTLNKQAENLYKITLGWYGILPIKFSLFAKGIGYVLLHTHDESNNETTPHLDNPTLPFISKITRLSGSGSDLILQTSSWRGGLVGKLSSGVLADRKFVVKTVKSVVGTNIPVYSVRNNMTFQGKINHVRIRVGTVTISTDGTKAVEFDVFKGGTLTGGVWTPIDVDNSVVDYNNTATSYTPAGIQSGGTVLGKVDRDRINLIEGDVVIPVYPGEELHFVATTSNANDTIVYFRHIEEF